MRLPQSGGCLCGAARYEITAPPLVAYACHCTICQRLTGSAFGLAFLVAAEACRFAPCAWRSYQRPAESGRVVTRWVCPECGVWICNGARPGSAPAGSFVALRAGTLDDPSWLRPTVHFWTRSAQPWVRLPAEDTCFATQPEDGPAWLNALRARPPGAAPGPEA